MSLAVSDCAFLVWPTKTPRVDCAGGAGPSASPASGLPWRFLPDAPADHDGLEAQLLLRDSQDALLDRAHRHEAVHNDHVLLADPVGAALR